MDHDANSLRLGPFVATELLGWGAMGEVWRGRHLASGLPVAIKTITADGLRTARNRELFAAEVEAVARLAHPGIVHIFDHGVVSEEAADQSGGRMVAGSAYLVMELASGGSLDSAPPSDWDGLRDALASVLAALAHAHSRGLVHRDLKPANVLVAGPDDLRPGLKLADFGAVWRLDVDRGPDAPRTTMGTPLYMAPEQILGSGHAIGPPTDLYALGCLAWALATGRPPFGGDDALEVMRLQLREDPPPFVPRFAVPASFHGWLLRLLEKDPEDRFATAAQALSGLGALSATGPATHDEPAPRPRLPIPETSRAAIPLSPLPLVDAGMGLFGLRQLPLLGRAREQDALWAQLREVERTGAARTVLLSGMPGQGKSRLARWLVERSEELGVARGLLVRADAARGSGSGFAPALRRALRTRADDAAVLDAVEAHLMRHGIEDDEEVRRLTHLALPESVLGRARGETGARFTEAARFAVLGRFLERSARDRPIVLWLDDVQWSFEALGFLSWFAQRQATTPSPVLMVATVRSDLVTGSPFVEEKLAALRAEGAQAMTVLPLGESATRDLVTELLHLSGELAEQVAERSGGTPLFAVQLVGDWVARGVLRATEDGFRLADGVQARVPDSVLQLFRDGVSTALAGRGPEARRELELAAALGNPASAEELAAASRVLGVGQPGAMEALARRGLVFRTRSGWEFAHVLLLESVAQDARDAGRWEEAHRACAEALGAQVGAGRIGRHLAAGGRLEEALGPLLDGALQSLGRAEYADALTLLDERDVVLARLRVLPHDLRSIDGELWRLRVQWRLPDLAGAWPRALALGEIVEATGRDDLRARFLLAKARTEAILLQMQDAAATYEALGPVAHLLETEQEEFDRRILEGQLLEHGSRREEAIALRRAGATWAQQIGQATFESTFLLHLGYSLLWARELDEADEVGHRLLAHAVKNGNTLDEAAGAALLGGVAGARNRGEEGLILLRRAHGLYASAGHHSEYIVLSNIAGALLRLGRPGAAREAAERVEQWWRARREMPRVALALMIQGASLADEGSWEAAGDALQRAIETLEPCDTAQSGGRMAEDLIQQAEEAGQPEIAAQAFRLALMTYERRGELSDLERVRAERARGEDRSEPLSAPRSYR